MILIADSGGSKTDWRLLLKDGTIGQANTLGFNPYYHPVEELEKGIKELIPDLTEEVDKIYFYGAGVSSKKNKTTVQKALEKYFPKAYIEIGWDLLAAARALCGKDPGIACILGTGSNSCLYNGEIITDNVANLGWILADEGSAASMGKIVVLDFLRGKLPLQLSQKLKELYPYDREEILEYVYQKDKPNAFLGGFSKFLFANIKEPYCYQLVYNCFADFYENNVMKYAGFEDLPVHFTGSIAFHFANILRQVGIDKGVHVGNILEGPISGLALYHQKDQ